MDEIIKLKAEIFDLQILIKRKYLQLEKLLKENVNEEKKRMKRSHFNLALKICS